VLDGYVASRSEIVNLVAGDNLLMLRRKFAETKGRNISWSKNRPFAETT